MASPPPDYFRHDPFAEAHALQAEWQRLYIEGERELLLEVDRDDSVLVAWRDVRKSFWDWVHRLQTIAHDAYQRRDETNAAAEIDLNADAELPQLDVALRANIEGFLQICRTRIKALS